ncbi:MAG: FAD:protein FMN transferase [candidate division WOR-3 bacterium]|nr:FAD:protein FMN transferase [candidate division WOR-3 bacterium]
MIKLMSKTKRQFQIKKISFILVFFVFSFNIFCTKTNLLEYEYNDFIFGSYIRFKVWAPDTALARKAVLKAMQELRHIDSIASIFNPNSEVNKINKNGYGKMSDDLKRLILKSIEVSDNSQGAFDITVGPVLKAYGFYGANQIAANKRNTNLDSIIGYKKIIIRGDSIFLKPNMAIDLGGITVGYALDKISTMLKSAGVKIGLIDAGGDIICFGDKTFNIGIKNPKGEGIVKTIPIKNQAISTSGNYEKFFNQNDIRYCHIINPKTSRPIADTENNLCSVTIIADNGVDADAYATAVFALGVNDGQNLIRQLKYRGILITNDGTIIEVNS